ncbi:hypothetical protein AYX14_01286 [Cryptococcus neoformans]|nr:hypothetical protein AYX15_00862 [Cryptococcus neoformans var. grubii]OWZ73218.1 hypothetical protein AYX14_01286 [Cryptococcus neoformans var. grubii]OWZ76626.1 hypothetical protein C365_04779 [Cryptococcus neoformans var. grubii Bt85]OXG14072.1 hypothetical protein C366_05067 [Cryptococcus neoformans var. grubii Tu401-1]
MANESVEGSTWGRVLICGGTDWATNGRKERSSGKAPTDLMEPHILRSLCNVKASKIITGPSANYAIVLDIHGAAYLFGRPPAMVQSNGVISESTPLKISPSSVGSPKGTKWVNGAAGRSHFLLVDSKGDVWGCGNNVFGQIGVPVATVVDKLTKVTGPWVKDPEAKVVQVTAGHTFSLFLTSTGQVYASGSSEFGQLGNGKTGERLVKAGKIAYDIEVPPRLVQGFENVKIIEIASGNQHSLALDDNGYVYSWGFAGYSRLGLQDQKDRLLPTIVPSFAGNNELTRARSIACGPTSSTVIDRQNMILIAGKWKLSGDGSTGQPYTRFKHIQDVMACKVIKTSSGGCTHFITTPDPEGGVMTVGFGQGVLYGELGLGSDSAKSATKPQKIIPLSGVDMIDVVGGAFFTLFLARPNLALSDLDRYPLHINSASLCLICNTDLEQDAPLECERCDQPYHIGCLSPPLSAVPEGEWFCPECALEADAGPDEPFKPALGITIPKPANGKKGVKQDVVETAGNPKALASATNGASTPSKFVKGGKRSREEERSAQGEMFPPINIYNCRLSIL